MKTGLYFLFLFCLLCTSCQKDEGSISIEADQTKYEVDYKGDVLTIPFRCNSGWTVISDSTWCRPEPASGNGNGTLSVTVDANPSAQSRKSRLVIRSTNNTRNVSQEILITQTPEVIEHHYKLPVIFHILYNNASDEKQNIRGEWLTEIVEQCNLFYKNKFYEYDNLSQDMNLEFVLATKKPDGTDLEEPGIERIQWSQSITISCDEFMDTPNTAYVDLLWDPNNYINIFVYAFKEDNVTGIAHLPYSLPSSMLDGLKDGSFYLDNPVAYPHCVSINNMFVYELDKDLDNRPLLTTTLSHELGHYLGLFHAFSSNSCEGTDYCDDTPNYNRAAYESWLDRMANRINFTDAVKRTACDNNSFTSYNMMDYYYSYSDRFTLNQRERVRHVLNNSPLIPGPKNEVDQTKLTKSAVVPEIRSIR